MRSRFRRALVGLLIVLVFIGGGLVARNLWEQRKLDLAHKVLQILPDAAQRIQNFHRVKMKGGRKVWEVSAREARYFEDEGTVMVDRPEVAMYFEDGGSVEMRGTEGRIFFRDSKLEGVEVEGSIGVQFEEFMVTTEHARYESGIERIHAAGEVRVVGENLELEGTSLEIDLGERWLRFDAGVRMRLWPDAETQG